MEGKEIVDTVHMDKPPKTPGWLRRMKDEKWIYGVKWKMSIRGLLISMLFIHTHTHIHEDGSK